MAIIEITEPGSGPDFAIADNLRIRVSRKLVINSIRMIILFVFAIAPFLISDVLSHLPEVMVSLIYSFYYGVLLLVCYSLLREWIRYVYYFYAFVFLKSVTEPGYGMKSFLSMDDFALNMRLYPEAALLGVGSIALLMLAIYLFLRGVREKPEEKASGEDRDN